MPSTRLGRSARGARHTGWPPARAFRRVYTPLQWRINRVVRLVVAVVILEALLLAGAVVQELPLVESVRNAMVVVGLVPNGLLLAIALAYTMEAVRLAGRGALVQQANAVRWQQNGSGRGAQASQRERDEPADRGLRRQIAGRGQGVEAVAR